MKENQTNVLILFTDGFHFSAEQMAKLFERFPSCHITAVDESDVNDEQLREAEVMVGFVKEPNIRKASRLKWLQLSSIGVDRHLNREMYCNPNILLTNSSGTYGKPISDYVIATMIMLAKSLYKTRDNQALHHWVKYNAAKDLFDSTVAVLGLGDVGSHVAQKAKALGMRVLAVKRTLAAKPAYVDVLFPTEEADQAIAQADFVVLAMAATTETAGFMDARRLALMRKDGYLINIGRGSLVDQAALVQALNQDAIAGAALDVTTPEPLPVDDPLWDAKNLILTPHISGKSPSAGQRQFAIFYRNLERYLAGQPLENVIDFSLGY